MRTLSAKDTGALEQLQNRYAEMARVLLDEQGMLFVELRQFDTHADSLIVEKR